MQLSKEKLQEEILREAIYDAIADAAHYLGQRYGVFMDINGDPYSQECIHDDDGLVSFCFEKEFILKYLDSDVVSRGYIDVFVDDYFYFNSDAIVEEVYEKLNNPESDDEWDV